MKVLSFRYMERKKDNPNGDGERPRSMLDITFQQKSDARFGDYPLLNLSYQ